MGDICPECKNDAYMAAYLGHLKCMIAGIYHEPNCNKTNLLKRAIMLRRYNQDVVKWLLQNGADPNAKCNECSLLFWAANKRKPECVSLLLQHGADLNVIDEHYANPLYLTSLCCAYDSAKIMIKHIMNNKLTKIINKYKEDPSSNKRIPREILCYEILRQYKYSLLRRIFAKYNLRDSAEIYLETIEEINTYDFKDVIKDSDLQNLENFCRYKLGMIKDPKK